MSQLLTEFETSLVTDYAVLQACQAGVVPGYMPSFAVSAPSAVVMQCGVREARVAIRLERWNNRPPPAADDWDVDELPWESSPGGGAVQVAGFDPPPTTMTDWTSAL